MTGQLPPVRRAPGQRPAAGPAALATAGFQVDQVRDAAREAGISEQFVQRALQERGHLDGDAAAAPAVVVREGIAPKRNPFLGATSQITFEAIVAGEMPERDFDVMVDTIRRALNDAGVVSQVGRSLTWTSADKSRRIQATVLVRDGRTTIHVSERLRELAGGLYGGIMGGGGGGMMGPIIGLTLDAGAPAGIIPVLMLAAAGLTYGIARTIFTRVHRSRSHVLRQLIDRLAEEARDSIARRTLAPQRSDRKALR
jgi:hypothetical protein